MDVPSSRNDVSPASAQAELPRHQLPAWVLSLLLHSLIVMLCGVAIRATPRGVAKQPDRTAGIVLVKHAEGEREYLDEEDSQASERLSQQVAGSPSAFPSADELAVDVAALLPREPSQAGAQAGETTAAPRAGELGGGTAASVSIGGSVRTGVFGVYGEGTRFVYVFDRSGSMGGFDGRPLRAAQNELAASLNDLDRIHQFQIIFYNETPSVFNPSGGRAKLIWADEAGKQLAQAFVRGITAAGGTRHMSALRIALGLNPDVIFFLTDADEPKLSAADLLRVRQSNSGTAIHAVEFGFGPPRNRQNFLVRLAKQNDGQHVYVDISKLPKD